MTAAGTNLTNRRIGRPSPRSGVQRRPTRGRGAEDRSGRRPAGRYGIGRSDLEVRSPGRPRCGDRALALLDRLAQRALFGIVVHDVRVVDPPRVRARRSVGHDVHAAKGCGEVNVQLGGMQERQGRLQTEGEEGDRCCQRRPRVRRSTEHDEGG